MSYQLTTIQKQSLLKEGYKEEDFDRIEFNFDNVKITKMVKLRHNVTEEKAEITLSTALKHIGNFSLLLAIAKVDYNKPCMRYSNIKDGVSLHFELNKRYKKK